MLLIAVGNLAAWGLAILAFRGHPLLIGTAVLAYGLGLRHAIDADHIAAIDNVTRKLVGEGKRPVSVGFFFSLGHSTVVVLATVMLVLATHAFRARIEQFHAIGGTVGTLVSAGFLLLVAALNLIVLGQIWRSFHHVRTGRHDMVETGHGTVAHGPLSRFLAPMFRMIRHGWHMYPLGLLFGLGFDTATEIGLIGLSAVQASKGLALSSILVFPALFTAAMVLIDTIDGILMLGAYGWATVQPLRKLWYNFTITFTSVIAALLIGAVETLGLIARTFGLRGWFWEGVDQLNANFGLIGWLMIILFAASWIAASLFYRLKGWHRVDMAAA